MKVGRKTSRLGVGIVSSIILGCGLLSIRGDGYETDSRLTDQNQEQYENQKPLEVPLNPWKLVPRDGPLIIPAVWRERPESMGYILREIMEKRDNPIV